MLSTRSKGRNPVYHARRYSAGPAKSGRLWHVLAAYGDDAQALAMAKYAWNELKLRHVALWVDESSVYTRTVGVL